MDNNQKELLIENADWIAQIIIEKFGNTEKALNYVNQISYVPKNSNCNEFWDKIDNTLKDKICISK